VSPPRPDPNREWKKSKANTEDLLALLNSGFLREKEVDMWRAAAGDPYPMEKNEDEILMFTRVVELVKYFAEVRKMERHFRGFTIEHLPRKNNSEADELAKKAARGRRCLQTYSLRS
jgi:ribonuclease HI